VKAGIIDEVFRGLGYEARSLLNGMNTGEPSYAGLSGLVKVLSALSLSLPVCPPAGGSFRGYRLSRCVARENHRERKGEETDEAAKYFRLFQVNTVEKTQRTQNGPWARYPAKNRPMGSPRWRKDVLS